MRIEFPARIMPERRSDEVARYTFSSQPTFSDASLGKPFQFQHGHLNRPVVQVQNTIILIERDHRHRLRRSNREVIKDAPISDGIPAYVLANRVHPLPKFLASHRSLSLT